MEDLALTKNLVLAELSLEKMDELWEEAKTFESLR
jgi:XTP/dITP diphosphohydrolase